jgi:hypothetical protein
MFRTTVFISAILLSTVAAAGSHVSHFVGSKRQIATLTGTVGHRSLSVTVSGYARLGAGIQADCELRAVEAQHLWRLVPFTSDQMDIHAQDVDSIHFNFEPLSNRAFRLETDFGEKNCPAGLSFSGIYRRH